MVAKFEFDSNRVANYQLDDISTLPSAVLLAAALSVTCVHIWYPELCRLLKQTHDDNVTMAKWTEIRFHRGFIDGANSQEGLWSPFNSALRSLT